MACKPALSDLFGARKERLSLQTNTGTALLGVCAGALELPFMMSLTILLRVSSGVGAVGTNGLSKI